MNQRIQGAVAPSGQNSRKINFGTGSDGAFSDGPAQTGISVSLPNITFNTDVKSTYEFTSFSLTAGKAITVTGSNPLIIRVAGTTTIAGTINANGSPGTGNDGASGNNVGAGPVAGPNTGGSGVASGGAGGTGASTSSINGTNGSNGSGSSAPSKAGLLGNGSNLIVNSEQGGGGGCNGVSVPGDNTRDAISGDNVVLPATNMGSCSSYDTIAQSFESVFTGGAGGGGGGAYTGGAPNESGGGGGGGGGAIRIVSLGNVSITGTINAKGGDGGNCNELNAGDGHCGAGGGGGSGGSVWVQTNGTLTGTGFVDLSYGAGGTSVNCGAGISDGGHGSRGIFLPDTPSGTHTIPGANITAGNSIKRPVTIPTGQTYHVYSRPLDLSASYYGFGTPTETLGCGAPGVDGTLTVYYEGSHDGVTFDKSVTKENISELNGYEYTRINVAIAVSSIAVSPNPPCLTGLTVSYDYVDTNSMRLKGGLFCGTISKSGPGQPPGTSPAEALGDFLVILLAALGARISTRKALQMKTA